MSLTCLWVKANSKATQCTARIVPWIHCSSETRDLHQALPPSSKNANENMKSYFDGNMTTNMISEVSFLWFTGPERMHRNMMEIKLEIWFQNHGICQGCVHSQGVNAKRHISYSFFPFFEQHILSQFLKHICPNYMCLSKLQNVFVKTHIKAVFIHRVRMQSAAFHIPSMKFSESAIGRGNINICFKSQKVYVWKHHFRVVPEA